MEILKILSIIVVCVFWSILADKKMVLTRKAILYSLPTSILMAIYINADLLLKYGFEYNGIQQLEVLLILIGLGVCFVGLPIYLALSSEDKNKTWIIWLAALCFLPFGMILYFVSLIWAISAKITQVKKNKKDEAKDKPKDKKHKDIKINLKKINFKKYKKIYFIIIGLLLLCGGIVFVLNKNNTSSVDCERARMLAKSINYTMKMQNEKKVEDAKIGMCGTWGIYKFSDNEIIKISKDKELYNFFISHKIARCQLILQNPDLKDHDDILLISSKLALEFVEEHKKCLRNK